MRDPWEWKLEDLEKLIGQQESHRLDFKQSKLFEEQRERIAENLTKEISAFANTEGGTIVVGIRERREGKSRIADSIDGGVSFEKWSSEQIQQIIESNVRPYLAGLRLNPVALGTERKRFALVIHVPKGVTAYQASDFKYYGRSEFESKALPDHHIRLLMFRGRSPEAKVFADGIGIEQLSVQKEEAKNVLMGHTEFFQEFIEKLGRGETFRVNKCHFSIFIKNTGEINLTEFKIRINFPDQSRFRIFDYLANYKDGWPQPSFGPYLSGNQPRPQRINIFPQDIFHIRTYEAFIHDEETFEKLGLEITWTLYLANRLPITGIINLAEEFTRLAEAGKPAVSDLNKLIGMSDADRR